jgi:hypothetical protein
MQILEVVRRRSLLAQGQRSRPCEQCLHIAAAIERRILDLASVLRSPR